MKKIINILALAVVAIATTSCGSHTGVTTPMRDAQHIAYLAETVTSEAELRQVEKLAAEMEHTYRTSFNGAKAREFKRLVEPILNEAGDRRDMYREAEEWLKGQQRLLRSTLDDLERAWSMALGTAEEEWAKIEAKLAESLALADEASEIEARKEQLAMDIVEAGYPEAMLNELGELEKAIEAKAEQIEAVAKEANIIIMAWQLQHGEDIIALMNPQEDSAVADTEPLAIEDVEE